MNVKVLLILISTFLLRNAIFAQKKIGLEIPNYSPHSPNVNSLGQYGEYHVEPSTGVPSISIPLYTVKGTKLELPISLSYHASGIKVDQEASFVGLGWVLNVGGNVARIIKDRPDDGNFGFMTTGLSVPDYSSIEEPLNPGTIGNNSTLVNLFERYDKEPDIFSVNANGLSDEFCLDNTGAFVSTGQDAFKYNVDLLNKTIIIRDKSGNIYRFGKDLDGTSAFETTSTSYSSLDGNNGASFPGHPSHPSSFHLTEIISADLSDTIRFKYKNGYYSATKVVSTARYLMNDAAENPTTDQLGRIFDGRTITSLTTTVTNVQIPDRIIFRNGYIEFSTADDRLDRPGGSSVSQQTRITGFTVYNENGNVIQRIVFRNAAYFNRTGVGQEMVNQPIAEHRRKSLKLDGVQFYDRNNVFINDYKFEYDETPLPPLNTSSQDLWGYYNGLNNASLVPQSFFQSNRSGQLVFIGETRATNFNYMKAGILKKIIYPTGGHTIYDYEPNYYLKKEQKDGWSERSKSISCYAVNRLASCDPEFLQGVPVNNTIQFQITEDLVVGSGNLYVMFTDYKVPANLMPMTFKITINSGANSYTFEHSLGEMSQRKVVEQAITIRKGDVITLEARTNGATGSNLSPCNSPYIQSGFSYRYWEPGTPTEEITPQQAGGLRVKTISNFDVDNKLLTKKIYEYGDTRYPVGVGNLITDPSKNFYNAVQLYAHNNVQSLKNLIWFSSDNQTELGLNGGCPVDYEKVVEKVISNVTGVPNGKTEYIYTGTFGDYEPKSSWKYPYTTVVYPSWKKSNLKKVTQYKLDNTDYVPVKSIEYEYSELPVKKIKTVKVIENEPDIYTGQLLHEQGNWIYFDNNPERFYYYNYFVSCGKRLKSKEIIKDFINRTDSLVTEKTFEYNSYLDISKEKVLNSKSELIENVFKYTGDLNYTDLISKNILSLPVQQESWSNGKVGNGSILKYTDFGAISERYTFASTTPLPPVSYNAINTIPPYYERRQSLFYDLPGKNIQEVRQESASSTSYLWSYANQHPIAEIRNANYSTIESVLGASAIINFASRTPTAAEVQAFLAPLRTDARLKDALITTYVFQPLIGMTIMTDPRGINTYYEYDGFGRLKLVRDQNGMILKQYDYQYQKPITQ